MRALRIDGRRVPCQTCRRRYAVIRWEHTMAVCGSCNRAFFMGYMLGRNAEADAIYEKYDLVMKKEAVE